MANNDLKGTSFPSSPAAGWIFLRTDVLGGTWCVYDGTDWVTEEKFTVQVAERTSSANDTASLTWVGDTYQPKFKRMELTTNVATTNNGTNYWTIRVQQNQLGGGGAQAISTVSTGDTPDTAGTAYDHSENVDTAKNTNYGYVFFSATKTLSPGNITWSATVYYQLIIT